MRIRIVDAFTDRPFAGNPAGVLLLDGGVFPPDVWLQQVAAELNLSETAFAHPTPGSPAAEWALRWFTPATEVDMCGHATLATAHVLREDGLAGDGEVRFSTRGGVLGARLEGAAGAVTLDFPAAPLTGEVPAGAPGRVAEALGVPVRTVLGTGPYVGDWLVEVADEETVRGLAPDPAVVAALGSRRGLVVTAVAADAGASGYDFVSRGFFPAVGIPEDPVTGSAHTALAPFWAERLGRSALTGYQASARGGVVRVEVTTGERVLLTGDAVTVVDGELRARLPA
jgi:PhzF family phenazine biosynthesis protein